MTNKMAARYYRTAINLLLPEGDLQQGFTAAVLKPNSMPAKKRCHQFTDYKHCSDEPGGSQQLLERESICPGCGITHQVKFI
jgi:hypothetical protein